MGSTNYLQSAITQSANTTETEFHWVVGQDGLDIEGINQLCRHLAKRSDLRSITFDGVFSFSIMDIAFGRSHPKSCLAEVLKSNPQLHTLQFRVTEDMSTTSTLAHYCIQDGQLKEQKDQPIIKAPAPTAPKQPVTATKPLKQVTFALNILMLGTQKTHEFDLNKVPQKSCLKAKPQT